MSTVPQLQEARNKVAQAQQLLHEAHMVLSGMLMGDKSHALGVRVGRLSHECSNIITAIKKHGAPHVN